mmetsp:Transcript_21346/g.66167  ORF Transcript_21346/g.66167 Transcript_21346/m.66167 type:complete len:380 (-) Transcript_21346:2082-3221(-)
MRLKLVQLEQASHVALGHYRRARCCGVLQAAAQRHRHTRALLVLGHLAGHQLRLRHHACQALVNHIRHQVFRGLVRVQLDQLLSHLVDHAEQGARTAARGANSNDLRLVDAHELDAAVKVGAPLGQHDGIVWSWEVRVVLFVAAKLVRQRGQRDHLAELASLVANCAHDGILGGIAAHHRHDTRVALVRAVAAVVRHLYAVVRGRVAHHLPEGVAHLGRHVVARHCQHALLQVALEGRKQHLQRLLHRLLALLVPRLRHRRLAVAQVATKLAQLLAHARHDVLGQHVCHLQLLSLDALLDQQRALGHRHLHRTPAVHGGLEHSVLEVGGGAVVPRHQQPCGLLVQPLHRPERVIRVNLGVNTRRGRLGRHHRLGVVGLA